MYSLSDKTIRVLRSTYEKASSRVSSLTDVRRLDGAWLDEWVEKSGVQSCKVVSKRNSQAASSVKR